MARSTKRKTAQLADDHLLCRTLGHAWGRNEPLRRLGVWGIRVQVTCERCEMVRKDVYDRLGQVASRSYAHPTGYRIAGGGVRRKDVWVEVFDREGVRPKGERPENLA